jgi:D-alanyl-D-alanine endopeptidase (penicillin-binding protein 7)
MSKEVLGIFVALFVFLFQVGSASAQDAKASSPQKSGKKTKRKAQAAAPAKTIAAQKRTPPPAADARKRPLKKASLASNSKSTKGRAQSKAAIGRSAARPALNSARSSGKKLNTPHVRKAAYQPIKHSPGAAAVAPVFSAGDLAGLQLSHDPLGLSSKVAYVVDESNSRILFDKNSDVALPIASLTKLMTGLVVIEAGQKMDEILEVTDDDIDREKNTSSRLRVGARLTRADMLHIALMSSENRAASALGRNYPGGLPTFVAAMNAKAKALGMTDTRYVEPTGLSSRNVASARDLAKLVIAAHRHPILGQYSTNEKYAVDTGQQTLQYVNSNRLVRNADWHIGLQKTGYITEAGRCLVMQVIIDNRPVVMVFLDSKGQHSRFADASRLRKWVLERIKPASTARVKLAQEQG